MRWDDQTRGLWSINKVTHFLETDEEGEVGWSDERSTINLKVTYFQKTEEDEKYNDPGHPPRPSSVSTWSCWFIGGPSLRPINKVTYQLETDEDSGGWSDERSPINQPVHVLSGDGRGRWRDQTRGLRSINKVKYFLQTDEEDGMGWSDEVCDQSTRSRTKY